ncbi:hypothetical protein M434DRAFT_15415 [Hypoxylon sp. CO27-5]|nr:hypothetical protein M434DRAFT_15415 [Hypoxylon sp. CO27-5]
MPPDYHDPKDVFRFWNSSPVLINNLRKTTGVRVQPLPSHNNAAPTELRGNDRIMLPQVASRQPHPSSPGVGVGVKPSKKRKEMQRIRSYQKAGVSHRRNINTQNKIDASSGFVEVRSPV